MNYKRGKPRTSNGGRRSIDRWRMKQFGDDWHWMCNYPRWWDIVFHRRPHRRRAMETTRAVLLGKVDADAAIWPVSKKPHNYYW